MPKSGYPPFVTNIAMENEPSIGGLLTKKGNCP